MESINDHGGQIFKMAALTQTPWQNFLDFSANINPQGQPRGLRTHLFRNFSSTLHYPEYPPTTLISAISNTLELDPLSLLTGAGSSPHIYLLPRIIKPERPVIIGPAFSEYEKALTASGFHKNLAYILTRKEDNFMVNPQILDQLWAKKPDAIFLANPANPTGRIISEGLYLRLAEEAKANNTWLVVDEAFLGFTSIKTVLLSHLPLSHPRLVILRSLTKIFALPGLRLAYLIAHPSVVSQLKNLTEPWSLGSMAQAAGLYCLKQSAFLARTPEITTMLRKKLTSVLAKYGRPYDSEANFLLFHYGPNYFKLISHLAEHKILVRNAQFFKGLEPGWLRLAVRPLGEIETLNQVLGEFHA